MLREMYTHTSQDSKPSKSTRANPCRHAHTSCTHTQRRTHARTHTYRHTHMHLGTHAHARAHAHTHLGAVDQFHVPHVADADEGLARHVQVHCLRLMSQLDSAPGVCVCSPALHESCVEAVAKVIKMHSAAAPSAAAAAAATAAAAALGAAGGRKAPAGKG